MIRTNKTRGFTLIELMLSMSFITVLMLAIAFLTIHITGIYNKGVTLKNINDSGLALSEDVQRSIASAPSFNLDAEAAPIQYVNQAGRGGRLCLGTYSYAWNYAASFKDGGSPLNEYTDDPSTPIQFIKVRDPQSTVCSPSHGTQVATKDASNELLSGGDRSLAVYDFAINLYSSDPASSQSLYGIDFTLGTNNGSVLDSTNSQCAPPKDDKGFGDYCAVNNFSIIARTSSVAGRK